jgi:hypothetical protein
VFNVPKDKWQQSLGIDNFSSTAVICEKHFWNNQVLRTKDIVDKLGIIILYINQLRPSYPYCRRHKTIIIN